MTQYEIIRMARELVTQYGSRMCDEDGETHGEELYCVGVEDIAEIIKQVAAHEREKVLSNDESLTLAHDVGYRKGQIAEREACAKVCEEIDTAAFGSDRPAPNDCAAAIRERGEK